MSDAADARGNAQALRTITGAKVALDSACAEIRSLRANLEEATRRYNEVVLAGLAKDAEIGRLRKALEWAREHIDRYVAEYGKAAKRQDALLHAIDAALSPPAARSEGEGR